jgi:hypothetical protein
VSNVSIGISEHNKIRRSKAIQNALAAEAAKIAAEANSRAGLTADDGYKSDSPVAPNPDLTVGDDSARAHVWASGEAVRAEKQNAYLMGIAGE